MSSCEKCWSDAHRFYRGAAESDGYTALLAQRKDTPCTPEEQAGPEAGTCQKCDRKTMHQHTGEAMCGCTQEES